MVKRNGNGDGDGDGETDRALGELGLSRRALVLLGRAAATRGILGGRTADIAARLKGFAADVFPGKQLPLPPLPPAADLGDAGPRQPGEVFWRERGAGRDARRREGSFYTPDALIDRILDLALFERLGKNGNEWRGVTVCDPAMGCGFFPLRLVERLAREGMRKHALRKWAGEGLFGVDTDPAAVFMARAALWVALSDGKTEFVPDASHFRLGDSLLGPSFGAGNAGKTAGLDWKRAFPRISAAGGFDVVLGNPPYEVLTNFTRHPERRELAEAIRSCGFYREALVGQINLYRCFIERGLDLLKPGGVLSFVVPLSLARDGTAADLRRRLLCREAADEWQLFGERERLFSGVTQSACVFRARRDGGEAGRLGIAVGGKRQTVRLAELERCGDGLVIPGLDRRGLKLWRWFYRHCPGRLSDVAVTRVGEVDQTVFRSCMSDRDTGCVLARGAHLSAFRLDAEPRPGRERFLDLPRFLALKGSSGEACRERAGTWRVAQLGIRNLHARPRLLAALAPPGVYLGNSLNVYYPRAGTSLAYLAGVLNSSCLDWLFRIGSGNNNINLREMAALPFPSRPSPAQAAAVEEAYRLCEGAPDPEEHRPLLDRAVADCYGLSPDVSFAELGGEL